MRKLFRNKVFIIFLILFIGIGAFFIWGLNKSIKTSGFVNIPEIEAEKILKNIYIKNDSVAGESIMITYSGHNLDMTYYVILKFANDKSLDLLNNTSSHSHRSLEVEMKLNDTNFFRLPLYVNGMNKSCSIFGAFWRKPIFW